MSSKTMRVLNVIPVLLLMAGLLSIVPHRVLAQDACPATDAANTAKQNEIILIVNAVRQKQGLTPLLVNDKLFAAALRQSKDMSKGDFLDHTGSDGSTMAGRVTDAGYTWNSVRENVLFRGDSNAQAAFDQWWNSPGHKVNMMADDVEEVGVAYECRQVDGKNKYYFTMDLGRSGSGATGSLPVDNGGAAGNNAAATQPADNNANNGNSGTNGNNGGGNQPAATNGASTCGNLAGVADQEAGILPLVNQARGQIQLPPLTINPLLTAAAQRQSNDMSTNDFLDHTGSDKSDVGQRVSDAGYQWTAVRENILFTFDLDPAKAFNQWWNSAGHKANMLANDVTEMGIAVGCTKTDNGTKFYYTMVLASSGDSQPANSDNGNNGNNNNGNGQPTDNGSTGQPTDGGDTTGTNP